MGLGSLAPPSLAWPAPPCTAGTQEKGPQFSGLGRSRSPEGRAAGSSQGTAAPVRQKLGVGPARLGQAPASPATLPAGGRRLWRPARSDTESPGCPDSRSRPPGPAGSLREGRGRAGGSDQGRDSSSFPSSLWSAVSGVPGPPDCFSPCSTREACTRRSREQPSRGAHFMAVESVRASSTEGGTDEGGGRQKLLKMFPGEERRLLSAAGLPRAWLRLCGWPSQWRALRDGVSGEESSLSCSSAIREWPPVGPLGHTEDPPWSQLSVGHQEWGQTGEQTPPAQHRRLLISWQAPWPLFEVLQGTWVMTPRSSEPRSGEGGLASGHGC